MFIVGLLFALSLGYSESVVCPEGFEIHGGNCYFFSHGVETWVGAFESCKLFEGSRLLEVNDATENNYIGNKVVSFQQANPNARYWIGLTDKQVENEWMWETSQTILEPGTYSNWGPNEPNGQSGENCVFYGGNAWGDAGCSRLENYICEKDGTPDEIIG